MGQSSAYANYSIQPQFLFYEPPLGSSWKPHNADYKKTTGFRTVVFFLDKRRLRACNKEREDDLRH
ncbi:protein of unknown function [Pseudodesulfovibrio profundus]|uniref:Uncharacterized protein n=1 Tax=Pseudodesulfovibrio profundus TaxID=57320 RepID=A0A2C8F5A9_9BACT|nr:protein of unknown function [Pseudodesulfovibrio profundus]